MYGDLISERTGKDCVIYKSVGEPSIAAFDRYLDRCIDTHHHHALNLVGAATSKRDIVGPTLGDAAQRVTSRPDCKFGCVTIAERHLTKGNEHLNIQRKVDLGAQWFISQAVYDFQATISLLNDYGDLCRQNKTVPKKVLLTFAPCGRRKTMDFIHWLGVSVPPHVEDAILDGAPPTGSPLPEIKKAAAVSVVACNKILIEGFQTILEATASSGIPLGLNVESVSGYREECEGVYTLFEGLQSKLLAFNKQWRFAVRLVEIKPTEEEQQVRLAYHTALTTNTSNALQLASAASFGVFVAVLVLKLRPQTLR